MYLEEHEPSLEAAIISAVEAERAGAPAAIAGAGAEAGADRGREVPCASRTAGASSAIRCGATAGALGGVVAIAAAIFLLGPAYMRHALSALLVISRSVEAAAPYRIEVTPGHSTIPRGADQPIRAKLRRLPVRPGGADGAQVGDRRLRARAADPR